ncbi:unnamed protein product [Allacma fusca]|uniref:C2H2-type domain-containing protein n=1 Tax=Allacma fusca TaxID=39272 RepID=A0A8J2MDS4_9HEXA|nr:unnamed protein product [Allacma fusca]
MGALRTETRDKMRESECQGKRGGGTRREVGIGEIVAKRKMAHVGGTPMGIENGAGCPVQIPTLSFYLGWHLLGEDITNSELDNLSSFTMDDDDGDLQISEVVEGHPLDLQVWDEELSEVQKSSFEAQKQCYEKYKVLRKDVKERKRTSTCELWTRKGVKSTATFTNPMQRVQLAQKTSFPVVISSMSTSQPQTIITGRINCAPVTSVSTVYTRPQISTVRAVRPANMIDSNQSMSQPMSVLHRNALQQQHSVQNAPIRATSVVPVQQFQNLLFDTNSGLLIMPTGQGGMNQQVAIRGPVVRQPTVSVQSNRPQVPRAPAPMVATTRMVNAGPNAPGRQTQQVMASAVKRVYTANPGSAAAKSSGTLQLKSNTNSSIPPKSASAMLSQQTLSTLLQSRSATATPKTAPTFNRQEPKIGVKAGAVRLTVAPSGASNGVHSNEDTKSFGKPPTVSITKVNNNVAEKNNLSNGLEKATIMNGSSDTNNNTSNSKTFPSLVVNVKPCLHDKPPRHEINLSRAELDQVVKNALVFAPSRFTEWLMQKGLLRLEHKCFLHKGEDGLPVQFKLGMYSDKDKEPFSGGYVWISDCCSGRQIPVYEGSIFDSSHHPPTTLLKLIYHWACQTSAANVLNWCKVSGSYLKNFYTLLRSVCVGALHELCPKMGGQGKYVEIGIITLGTTLTVASGKKQVKIEILGVFDPESKVIRMKLINPAQPSSSATEASKTRGVQILSPLNIWVEKASTLLIDGSIEQDLLLEMGFKNLVQCQSPNDEDYDPNAPTNVNVMNYLKHVVPKMFQNTLCVLSKSLIQQFLDELSWREKWGKTPSGAFDNILEHIKTMTNWDFGPNSNLVAWLNKISMNPFQDWSYTRALAVPTGIDLLPESIRRGDTMPSLSAQVPEAVQSDPNGLAARLAAASHLRNASKPPVLLPQVPTLMSNGPLKRKTDTASPLNTFNVADYFLKTPKTIVLESYYYAELPGIRKDVSGEFPQNVKCPLCSKPFFSNVEVYRHIYSHVHAIGRAPSTINFCSYCLKDVSTASLPLHIEDCHKMGEGFVCRICQERFTSENAFVIHMWENHCEADTPYTCELCDYKSSFQYQVIDHYNQVHKGSDSVLCPLCLKMLSAKSYICLKQITVHIQTHQMRKGKKCPHCCLVFFGDLEYRHHILEGAHKSRPINSRKIIYYSPEDKTGILMAKPPNLTRAILQPPNKKPRPGPVDQIKKALSNTKVSTTSIADNMYKIREHCVSMHDVGARGCLECQTSIERSEHFPGYMSCIKCRFSTCCKSAMQSHHATAHPMFGSGRKVSSIKVVSTEMMKSPLLCQCGFESINPNRLARHLALCDKTTAFPLDWEEQLKKRAGLPPPEPLTPLDHLEMMRDPSR